jgi:hypothetical protein
LKQQLDEVVSARNEKEKRKKIKSLTTQCPETPLLQTPTRWKATEQGKKTTWILKRRREAPTTKLSQLTRVHLKTKVPDKVLEKGDGYGSKNISNDISSIKKEEWQPRMRLVPPI